MRWGKRMALKMVDSDLAVIIPPNLKCSWDRFSGLSAFRLCRDHTTIATSSSEMGSDIFEGRERMLW